MGPLCVNDQVISGFRSVSSGTLQWCSRDRFTLPLPRQWIIGFLVSYEPITPELKVKYLPMLENCDKTIKKLMVQTMSLDKFLLPESEELERWQDYRNLHFESQQEKAMRGPARRDGVKTVSWPNKHLEIFRTHDLCYPVVIESLYASTVLYNMRTLPRRAKEPLLSQPVRILAWCLRLACSPVSI